MTQSKQAVWHIASSWLRPDRYGRRSPSDWLHHPKLLGSCGRKCLCFYRCWALRNIWIKTPPQSAGRGDPHGGAAGVSGPGFDDALFAPLAAVDWYCGACDGAFCRARGSTTARAASLWLVVLRPRHWLHDDVIGSGDGVRLNDRLAAESVVRPALCNTAPRYDLGKLHDW